MGVTRSLISFDWALKRLLRNKANFGILEGFLSELLKTDITISSLGEYEGNQESANDKYNRVDIAAVTGNNEIILIELQVNFEADYFHRILYGTSKTLVDHVNLGDQYKMLKKVYSINIVYFDLGQGDDYVYHGVTEFSGIHQKDILLLSAKQRKALPHNQVFEIFPEYYILKINSFGDVAKDSLDEWIYFFKNNEIPDQFKARGLAQAKVVLKTDKMSSAELVDYNRHWENVRYAKSMIWSAMEEGKFEGELIGVEKGIEQGIEKGKLLPLFYPLRQGKGVDEVADFTNTSIELVAVVKNLIEKYGADAENHLDELG